jgi:hypothetical protein
MLDPNIRYIAQDNNWNGSGLFVFDLMSGILDGYDTELINLNITYDSIEGGVAGKFHLQSPDLSAVIHCRCKSGVPSSILNIRFNTSRRFEINWPGVLRIFVRIRIMESTSIDTLSNMLLDDLCSGHSVSDIDDPDIDQSFRPWSDDEDSETETVDDCP